LNKIILSLIVALGLVTFLSAQVRPKQIILTEDFTFSSGATVTGLPTPTGSSDAATKGYVDGAVSITTYTVQSYSSSPQTAATQEAILLDTTSTAIVLNMPDCSGAIDGSNIRAKLKTKGAGNNVTVTPFAGDTIDGNASYSITLTGQAEDMVCDSVNNRWELW